MGLASKRLTQDPSKLVVQPPRHLLVVAFTGLTPGLLAGPSKSPLEDLTHMLRVVIDVELTLD